MPSVGRSFVGRRKCCNSAWPSFGAVPGADRSTAKFLVVIRLVTVSTGGTPAGNSAVMIPIESARVSISFAVAPSALKSFARVFWKGVGLTSAAGIHIRVVPEGLRTCALVVTSNVRQASGAVPFANSRPAFGNAIAADATPAERRKSRRFIESPLRPEFPLRLLGQPRIYSWLRLYAMYRLGPVMNHLAFS